MALSLIDGLVFALLVVSMTLVRYDFHASLVNVPGMLVCSAIGLIVFLIGGPLAIYRGRYRRGSTDQFAAIVGTVAVGVGVMWVVEFAFASQLLIPTSVPITAGALMVVIKSLENWIRRNLRQRSLTTSGASRPTIVVGAGNQGMLALYMIAQDTHNEFVAVGILDDDPAKRHLRYNGIRVLGPIAEQTSIPGTLTSDVWKSYLTSVIATTRNAKTRPSMSDSAMALPCRLIGVREGMGPELLPTVLFSSWFPRPA